MQTQLQKFNQMIAPYFQHPARHKLPEQIKSHDFEHTIKGVDVIVSYTTRWDSIDCENEIVYQSIKVFVDGADITPLMSPDAVDSLRHPVEADWERIGQEAQEDLQ